MSFESSSNKKEGMSINEAFIIISAIEHQTYQLGGNDTEKQQFDVLRAKVESGALKPSEGITQAEQILENKNSNYH